MGGAEQEKRRLTLRTPKASRFGGFRKQGGFANGQPPLHFLTALNRACHSDRAAATKGFSQLIQRL
jgi:hypothetical protein